jgi:hypothetical protein
MCSKLFDGIQDVFTCRENTPGMSDLLAIVGDEENDEQLLVEIARRHPDRVTVLVEDGDADLGLEGPSPGSAMRDRLARLLRAIELRTGAVVVGLAGSPSELRGWRFDRVVGARGPLPV